MAGGIMSRLFGGVGAGTPVNGVNPPQPNPQPQDGAKGLNNPGAIPSNIPPNNSDNKPADPTSPLDTFKDVWKTTTSADGKPPVDPLSQPLLNTDPVKFKEAVGKLNFTSGTDPELLKKALAGDPQAFADAINAAAQQAFMASATLSQQAIEGASQTNNKRLDSVMEAKFKEYLVRNERSDNPVLKHPSAAPMLDLAKRQLTQQHPDKSPAEIHQMAESYLVTFGEELVGNKTKQEAAIRNTGPDPYDFSTYGT